MNQPQPRLPAAFIGHGSPMNAIESNRFTMAWRDFGAAVVRPRAILVVSAHWYIDATAVTAMAHPRTVHDFYGFPPELFAVTYLPPGDPALAAEVVELLAPTPVESDRESWGIDHGAWSVLVHAFPRADIPVVQLAIDARRPLAFHLELGRRLAPLRDRGVLVIASGNVVHNLRRLTWSQPDFAFDWAQRFDEAAKAIMVAAPAEIARLGDHPDFGLAVPTPDHFLPLAYFAGLAAEAGTAPEIMIEGCAMGSLSMTSYVLEMARGGGGEGRM